MARLSLIALLAAASTLPLERCYDVEYRLTVMPDGSGKVEVLISQQLTDNELKKPFPLLAVADWMKGYIALTPAKTEVKDGWRHSDFTVYFEDINKFVYKEKPERKCEEVHANCFHFSLAPSGDGFALTIEDWGFVTEAHRNPKENWEELKKDSVNVVKWNVTMPGKVTKVDGFQKMEGRSALYERSSKTITNVDDAVKWPLCRRRVVECGKPEPNDAEWAAFKAEIHKARAAWLKLKPELEAARAKDEEK